MQRLWQCQKSTLSESPRPLRLLRQLGRRLSPSLPGRWASVPLPAKPAADVPLLTPMWLQGAFSQSLQACAMLWLSCLWVPTPCHSSGGVCCSGSPPRCAAVFWRSSVNLAQQSCVSATLLQSAALCSTHFCTLPLQALEPANLGPGKRVLVHAGSGGVGSMAIQLSKLRGAYVVTTCSHRSFPHVKVRGRSPPVSHSRPLGSCASRAPWSTHCSKLHNAGACTCLGALLVNERHSAHGA